MSLPPHTRFLLNQHNGSLSHQMTARGMIITIFLFPKHRVPVLGRGCALSTPYCHSLLMVLVDGSGSCAGSVPFWMNSLSHRAALLLQRTQLLCRCDICNFSQALSVLKRAEEGVGVCTAPECLQPSHALATIPACIQKMHFGFVCSFQE